MVEALTKTEQKWEGVQYGNYKSHLMTRRLLEGLLRESYQLLNDIPVEPKNFFGIRVNIPIHLYCPRWFPRNGNRPKTKYQEKNDEANY